MGSGGDGSGLVLVSFPTLALFAASSAALAALGTWALLSHAPAPHSDSTEQGSPLGDLLQRRRVKRLRKPALPLLSPAEVHGTQAAHDAHHAPTALLTSDAQVGCKEAGAVPSSYLSAHAAPACSHQSSISLRAGCGGAADDSWEVDQPCSTMRTASASSSPMQRTAPAAASSPVHISSGLEQLELLQPIACSAPARKAVHQRSGLIKGVQQQQQQQQQQYQQQQYQQQQQHDIHTPFMHTRSMGLAEYSPPIRRLNPYDPSPRAGYLEWDDYFMALAFLSAQRSKDPSKQVGAVIVDANKVVLGIGYNGFPRGCPDAALPWAKKARARKAAHTHPAMRETPSRGLFRAAGGTTQSGTCSTGGAVPGSTEELEEGGADIDDDEDEDKGALSNPLGTKYPYVVHAEANALLNKNAASVFGASVYVTLFPCNECAKLLIQAGIREVVYHEGKVHDDHQHHNNQPYWSTPPMGYNGELLVDNRACSGDRTATTAPHSPGEAGDRGGGRDQRQAGGRGTSTDTDHHASALPGSTAAGQPGQQGASGAWGRGGVLKGRQAGGRSMQGGACGEGGSGCGQAATPFPPPPPLPRDPSDACYVASKHLLRLAGVTLRQHRLDRCIVLQGT